MLDMSSNDKLADTKCQQFDLDFYAFNIVKTILNGNCWDIKMAASQWGGSAEKVRKRDTYKLS